MRQTGVRHQMVWDPTGASWRYFGVASQPSSILVAPDGRTLAVFKGTLSLDRVLAAAGG